MKSKNITFLLLGMYLCPFIFLAQKIEFKKVEIDTTYGFRGLSVVDDSVVWVSGRRGVVGKSINGGKQWKFSAVKGAEKTDFRSLFAFNGNEALIANTGSPGHIMCTADGGVSWNIVFTKKDSLAFFDGMDFWNDKEGMAYGDPINGRMLLVYTNDGGKTWTELPGPELMKGESSFAASGTGIRCYGKEKIMICTGGKTSRLFISTNKGKSWNILTPPIIQGNESRGIFSVAFANEKDGIIVGGDYKIDTLKQNNVFYTRDGGKTWKAPEQTTGGYRECVEFISKNIVIASGIGGADISTDGGITWTRIENQKNFHVIRKARTGKLIIAAGNKRISVVRIED